MMEFYIVTLLFYLSSTAYGYVIINIPRDINTENKAPKPLQQIVEMQSIVANLEANITRAEREIIEKNNIIIQLANEQINENKDEMKNTQQLIDDLLKKINPESDSSSTNDGLQANTENADEQLRLAREVIVLLKKMTRLSIENKNCSTLIEKLSESNSRRKESIDHRLDEIINTISTSIKLNETLGEESKKSQKRSDDETKESQPETSTNDPVKEEAEETQTEVSTTNSANEETTKMETDASTLNSANEESKQSQAEEQASLEPESPWEKLFQVNKGAPKFRKFRIIFAMPRKTNNSDCNFFRAPSMSGMENAFKLPEPKALESLLDVFSNLAGQETPKNNVNEK